MNTLAITYLNRLSDLVFILARYANREGGDVLWVPGGQRGADRRRATRERRQEEGRGPEAEGAGR